METNLQPEPLEIAYRESVKLGKLSPTHELLEFFKNFEDRSKTKWFYEKFSMTKKAPEGAVEIHCFYAEYFQALRKARKEIVEQAFLGKRLEITTTSSLIRHEGVCKEIKWDEPEFCATIALGDGCDLMFIPETFDGSVMQGQSCLSREVKMNRIVRIL